jgi:PAS domain S-box-containing protein
VAVIVVAGIAASGLAFHLARTADEARVHADLDLRAEWRAKDVEHKIDVAAFPVQAAATFVASQNEIRGEEVEEFRQFVVQARADQTPIRSIAWVPQVPRGQRAQFEADARAMGLADFRILEPGANHTFVPAQDRAEYYPVLFHVGFEGQPSVTGVDLGSAKARREPVLRARDTGRGAATGRFGMLTLDNDDPSYLVAFPIYSHGSVPSTVEERRARFRGVVYGAFQLRRMLSAAIEHTPDIRETIAFSFGRSGDSSPQPVVAVYSPLTKAIGAAPPGDDPAKDAAYRSVRSFEIMGQRWTLASGFSTEMVAAQRSAAPLAVLLAGLLLTTALGAYVARERRQFERIHDVVTAQTADLRQSNDVLRGEVERREQAEDRLRDAIENISDGFVLYDTNQRLVLYNERYRELRDYDPAIVLGTTFEAILRSAVARGEILVPAAETEPWIENRLRQHRSPTDPTTMQIGKRWIRMSERRTRDGGTVSILADITELKSAETELRQTNSTLSTLLANLPFAVSLVGPDLRLQAFNAVFRDDFGLSEHQLKVGDTFEMFIRILIDRGQYGQHDPDGVLRKRMEFAANPKPERFEVSRPDGRVIDVRLSPLPGGGFVTARIDITALKQAQAEVEAARVRMADWTAIASDWFWEADADGNLTFLSDSFEAGAGVKIADRLGKPRIDLLAGDHADEPKWQAHLAANAARRPFRDFVVETTKFVRTCHMSVSGKPIFDASGRFAGYRGTTRDVTARVEAEQALERQTSTLSTLIENLPIGVALMDRDLRLVAFNQPYLTCLDLPPNFVEVGDPVEKVFRYNAARGDYGPGDIETLVRGSAERIRKPQPRHYETVRHNGKVVEISGRPLPGGGLVSTFTDITEKQKVEKQIAQAVKMDAVGQLTGGIAHDFNNLLGIVIGNLDQQIDTLDHRPGAADEIKTLGREALDASLRGAELVRRLLAFSRSQPLQPQVIDVGATVREVEPLLWRALGEHVTVETHVASDLWTVSVDPTQLENVIVNLAINARDAMPNGGHIKITCTNRSLDAAAAEAAELSVGDYVAVSVCDTGTGIPPDVLAHVFEPFFTTKEVGKGSGLGLSMVYGYARQSGGGVRIYSELGRGTEVRVYLPRAHGDAAAGETTSDEPAAGIPSGHERVLLVEDKAEVRAMAARLLTSLGYQILEAESGVSALELINRGTTFDVLFTDIVMPGNVTGIDLAHEVRRQRPGLPILLTSGFSDPETLHAEATALGVQVLRKPYRKAELAEYLRMALDRAAARVT